MRHNYSGKLPHHSKAQSSKKDIYVDATGLDKGKSSYRGRSRIRFGFLNVEKSAEVIVAFLRLETKGMPVAVERTD